MVMIEKATDANLFNAVRVDGIFDEVHTRTVQRQARPFPPLTEAAKHQAEKIFTNVEGTLAGFRSPIYAQGIGVAGFHLHFLHATVASVCSGESKSLLTRVQIKVRPPGNQALRHPYGFRRGWRRLNGNVSSPGSRSR
jgi:alpha-acetolactate decarboxylase